jgi:hypothetical protein
MKAEKTYTQDEVRAIVAAAVKETSAGYETKLKAVTDDRDARVSQALAQVKMHSAENQRLRGDLPKKGK